MMNGVENSMVMLQAPLILKGSHQKFTINYELLCAQMVNQLKIAVNIHCLKEGMKLFLGFGYLPDTFFRTILG